MKHVINHNVTSRFIVTRMWCAAHAIEGFYNAGQIDRQQHYRESDSRSVR